MCTQGWRKGFFLVMIYHLSGPRMSPHRLQMAGQVPREQTLVALVGHVGSQALGAAPQGGYVRVKSQPDSESRGGKSQVHKLLAAQSETWQHF